MQLGLFRLPSLKNLFPLFLLFFSIASFGQEIHFFDVHGNRITKEQFERQRDNRVNLGLSFQKGKITETRLVVRTNTGVISPEVRNAILLNLQQVSGKIIDKSEMIIINYYQGKDKCNSSGSNSASLSEREAYIAEYQNRISRLGQTSKYNMFAVKEGIVDPTGLLQYYPDVDLLVEKTFFKYKYPCGSFVIIKPDGEYYAYFGEYSTDQVIKQAKKLLKNNVRQTIPELP